MKLWMVFCKFNHLKDLWPVKTYWMSYWNNIMKHTQVWKRKSYFQYIQCRNLIWPFFDLKILLGMRQSESSESFTQENAFEKVVCTMAAILSWPQYVKLELCLVSQGLSNHTYTADSTQDCKGKKQKCAFMSVFIVVTELTHDVWLPSNPEDVATIPEQYTFKCEPYV